MSETARSIPAPGVQRPARLVVLVSGSGTNLQALLDASLGRDPHHQAFPVEIVAVGADRPNIEGLARAERDRVPTFVHRLRDYPHREAWDAAMRDSAARYRPDLVVCAGLMKLLGPHFLGAFPERVFNTHPALLPSFPGTRGPADALAYGVTVTGATLFIVDEGTDTGAIVAQTVVPVEPGDTVDTLHERIKTGERAMLVDRIGALARCGWTVHESPRRRKVTLP